MEDDIKQDLTQIMNDFLYEYMSNSVEGGHTATGNLATSGAFNIQLTGKVWRISVSFADYWKWAEYGRKPGKFPPIEKIKEWIRVKPVLPRPTDGKLPTENQLAFLIARKIATKGTKGSGVYAKTVKEFDLTGKLYDCIANNFLEFVTENKFF